MVIMCLVVGMLPLVDLRTRWRRDQPPTRAVLAAYFAVGAAEIGAGLFLVFRRIKAFVWGVQQLWMLPFMALLPPFTLFWFGTTLLWRAVDEYRAGVTGQRGPELAEPNRILPYSLCRLALAIAMVIPCLAIVAWHQAQPLLYWRAIFFSLALTAALLPLTVELWLVSRGVLRPAWLFLTLNLASFGVEYFARLTRVTAWQALGVGLLGGGALFILTHGWIRGNFKLG
jgi:hypothetical protein